MYVSPGGMRGGPQSPLERSQLRWAVTIDQEWRECVCVCLCVRVSERERKMRGVGLDDWLITSYLPFHSHVGL